MLLDETFHPGKLRQIPMRHPEKKLEIERSDNTDRRPILVNGQGN